MSRILLFFLFLPYLLFSSDLGCFRFFPGSFRIIDGHPAYAVSKTRFVSLHCPKGKKVAAHDSFRGLCLFEERAERPFRLMNARSSLTYCPSDGRKVEILTRPVAVWPGKLKGTIRKEGALFGECCKLAGLVRNDGGWYDTEAIRRLMRGDTYHGDVGVRWRESEGGWVVESVDPWAEVPLKRGDRLVSVEDKKGDLRKGSWHDFWRATDRCSEGKHLTVTVRRAGEKKVHALACFPRYGGGEISDTFLERFGLRFDSSLNVIALEKESSARRKGLRVGDRLMMVEKYRVENPTQVRLALTRITEEGRKPRRMLWEREGFQFFLLPGAL